MVTGFCARKGAFLPLEPPFIGVPFADGLHNVRAAGQAKGVNLQPDRGLERRRVHGNLRKCVEAAGMAWEGRMHSGLDDARNTARLAAALLAGGAALTVTGFFPGCDPGGLRQRTLFPDRSGSCALLTSYLRLYTCALNWLKRRVLKKHRVTDTTGKWNGKCECGVKARLCTVRRPCANLGRQFWGCGTWTQLQGKGGCTFLKWIDEVIA